MIGLELASEARMLRVMAPQVAGATAVNGSVIDTQGYERICFVGVLGDGIATATASMKLQTGDRADGADATDVAGAITATVTSDGTNTDNKLLILDIVKPTKRYSRIVVNRAVANHVIDSVIALLYDARLTPVVQDGAAAVAIAAG